MREKWAEHFTERAREYWTKKRVQELTGGDRLAILPDQAPVLLRALGLLHRDASMPPRQVRKYRQINHMVAVLGPSMRALRERYPKVRILDAACGRSYLSTLLAWDFVHHHGHPVEILGVDRNPDLIEDCRRRSALVELEDVIRYREAELDTLDVAEAWAEAFGSSPGDAGLHGLVSLHACDTATDDALALGMRLRIPTIAVVPCCQAELAAKWASLVNSDAQGPFRPIWESPHLRRSHAAEITDSFRVLLLRAAGYEVSAIEFVASSHTPKNTLIRGTLIGADDSKALADYEALREATGGAGIGLEDRLPKATSQTREPHP